MGEGRVEVVRECLADQLERVPHSLAARFHQRIQLP